MVRNVNSPYEPCGDPESFVRGGPTLTMLFFSLLVFRWRANDGPTLNDGLLALWFLRGSGPVLFGNPIFL